MEQASKLCSPHRKRKHFLFATLIFSFTFLEAAQCGQPDNEWSPSSLKGLAQNISAENPRYSTLTVEAFISEPRTKTAIGYRLYYSKETGYALYVRDMRDGTPTEKTITITVK